MHQDHKRTHLNQAPTEKKATSFFFSFFFFSNKWQNNLKKGQENNRAAVFFCTVCVHIQVNKRLYIYKEKSNLEVKDWLVGLALLWIGVQYCGIKLPVFFFLFKDSKPYYTRFRCSGYTVRCWCSIGDVLSSPTTGAGNPFFQGDYFI